MPNFSNSLSCPVPKSRYDKISIAHGGGGKHSHALLNEVIAETLGSSHLEKNHDAATIRLPHSKVAMTTDSYVISPIEFPGGDIGKLSVCGTVNDLSCVGATPHILSCGLILQEGLAIDTLSRILRSMKKTADECGVKIITGDTKVIEAVAGSTKEPDLFINTTGIGVISHARTIHPSQITLGDDIIVSGDVGRHGIAVMAVREGLSLATDIQSDCAAIFPAIQKMLELDLRIKCIRDLTRGGLSSALNEIALSTHLGISIEEKRVPIHPAVKSACEILGFDPLTVACEGRFVLFVDPRDTAKALECMQTSELGKDACTIGHATFSHRGSVISKSAFGTERFLEMISGEQLPRIC